MVVEVSRDIVRAAMEPYAELAQHNMQVVFNLKKFHNRTGFRSMPEVLTDGFAEHVRAEIDSTTEQAVGRAWGPDAARLSRETRLWQCGSQMSAPSEGYPAPFGATRPERMIRTLQVYATLYGAAAVPALAAAFVESGGLLVDDGVSIRRAFAEAPFPRTLYVRHGYARDDITGAPLPGDTELNSNNFGLHADTWPKAMLLHHLFAAPIGLAGPRAILELWDARSEQLYQLGLTRPNDLWAEPGRLRAVFDAFLADADEEGLRFFTLGPQRLPLSGSALLAAGGERIIIPAIRTWDDLVHAAFPRHHRDIWSTLATPALPHGATTDQLRQHVDAWCDERRRPHDWSPASGLSTQHMCWLRALGHVYADSGLPGSAGYDRNYASIVIPEPPLEPSGFYEALRSVTQVMAAVATITATAAGLFFSGGNPAALTFGVSMLQMLSRMAASPEGAAGEVVLWASRLKMPIDQLSLADQVVMKRLGDTVSKVDQLLKEKAQ